ncbi:unnamed protein product [Durusdinium trenchii]|uniref:Cell division protein ZapE (Z ring-associated protein ZapE) n=2 Tax=Durusdinium trenchii TaxID=1381693 RepID=A0ABP0LVP0_9DINO
MWAMRWRVPWRRFHFSSVPQKLKDSYKAQVEAGGLEKDGLQERVVGYLSQALEKALQREQHQPSNTRDGSGQELGFAGHPGWVLPLETIGGSSGSGAAEEHRRAAEWTAKLAAENRRRLAKGTQAKVLPAATGISQVETQRTAEPASEAQEAPPKREPLKSSVYLHGPVGTGKTMLMNLFHDHSQQAGLRTSRQHFYEFMISLHQQIQKDAAERPVEVAANRWADDLDVLCFDEFQITDIQDAVILPRLFEVLFLRGVTVAGTPSIDSLCSLGLDTQLLTAIVQRAEEEAVDEPQWSDDSDVSESELANVVMEMQEVTKSMPCPERPGAVPKIGAVPARAMPRQRGTQLEELHVVLVIDASLSMGIEDAELLMARKGSDVQLPTAVRRLMQSSTPANVSSKLAKLLVAQTTASAWLSSIVNLKSFLRDC